MEYASDNRFRERLGAVRKPHHRRQFSETPGPVGSVCNRTLCVNVRKNRHVFHRKVLLIGNTSYIM